HGASASFARREKVPAFRLIFWDGWKDRSAAGGIRFGRGFRVRVEHRIRIRPIEAADTLGDCRLFALLALHRARTGKDVLLCIVALMAGILEEPVPRTAEGKFAFPGLGVGDRVR